MGTTQTVLLAAVALVLAAPGPAAAQKRISWEGEVRMTDAYTHAYDSGGTTSCEGSADTVLTVQYELPQHSAPADGTPPHGLAALYDLSNQTGRATGTGNCSGDAGPCGTFTSQDTLSEVVAVPDQPNAAQGSIRYYPEEGKVEFVFGGGESGFTFEGADFTESYSNPDCGTQTGERPSWPVVHVGGPRLEKDPTWEQGDDDFRLPVEVRGVELFVRGTFFVHRDGGSAGQSFNGLPIGNYRNFSPMDILGPTISLSDTETVEIDMRGLLAADPTKLTTVRRGDGEGVIRSTPQGVDCGDVCEVLFERGERVTLEASPDPGSIFSHWEDGCQGTTVTCELTMDQAKQATAVFSSVQGSFTWYMRERYNGADRNGDGLADYFTPLPDQFVPWPEEGDVVAPDRWRVDFRAHDCAPDAPAVWIVDGVPHTDTCQTYFMLAEGPHEVSLRLAGKVVETQYVTPRDWLIAAIGDSYGSGEGNPDVPKVERRGRRDIRSRWEDPQCHRSAFAGAAQAAAEVERADVRSSVTLLHLACSGATVMEGLLGEYGGAAPDAARPPKKPQIQELASLLRGRRHLDALLISIGGNDIGFAEIIKACLIFPKCDSKAGKLCLPRPLYLPARAVFAALGLEQRCAVRSAREIFDEGLSRLTHLYNRLRARVRTLPVDQSRVIVMGYPDVTRGGDGNFCGTSGNRRLLYDALPQVLAQLDASYRVRGLVAAWRRIGYLTIDGDEARWAGFTVLRRLNDKLERLAGRYTWTYVGDHVNAAKRHGYCARNPWVRRWTEAKKLQEALYRGGIGQSPGAVHPNFDGHRAYRDALLPALRELGMPTG